MDEEIVKLQEIISHQGEDLARLSEEYYMQQKEIGQLRNKIDRILAAIEAMAEESNTSPVIDKPPHY